MCKTHTRTHSHTDVERLAQHIVMRHYYITSFPQLCWFFFIVCLLWKVELRKFNPFQISQIKPLFEAIPNQSAGKVSVFCSQHFGWPVSKRLASGSKPFHSLIYANAVCVFVSAYGVRVCVCVGSHSLPSSAVGSRMCRRNCRHQGKQKKEDYCIWRHVSKCQCSPLCRLCMCMCTWKLCTSSYSLKPKEARTPRQSAVCDMNIKILCVNQRRRRHTLHVPNSIQIIGQKFVFVAPNKCFWRCQ